MARRKKRKPNKSKSVGNPEQEKKFFSIVAVSTGILLVLLFLLFQNS